LKCKFDLILHNDRPDALDSTLRRPGRLDRELEIRAPTVAERKEIINVLLKKIPHSLEAKEVEFLASVTHGFVGADLLLLCAEASLAAAKRVISSNLEGIQQT
jgi:AAA family ATPase